MKKRRKIKVAHTHTHQQAHQESKTQLHYENFDDSVRLDECVYLCQEKERTIRVERNVVISSVSCVDEVCVCELRNLLPMSHSSMYI